MASEISETTTKHQQSSSGMLSPLILALFAAAVILTGIIAVIFGHKFGYQQGYSASQKEVKMKGGDQTLSVEETKELQSTLATLREQVSTAKQERDISLNNLGLMRKEVDDLELENMQLSQVNEVYSEALVDQGGIPLQIVGAKMAPLPEHAFEYRFDVAMLADDGQPHRLKPKLTLLDEENLVEVPLDPSSYRIKGIARIRGRFVMPEGFNPKQAKISLSAGGENVEQIYNWKLDKPVDEMPLSLSEVPQTDQRPVSDEE